MESIIPIHQREDIEMAWLERDRSGNIHVCFRLGERKFKRSLRTKDNRSATASCSRVEENIRLLEMGRLTIPAGANVAAFLLSDGKLIGKPEISESVPLTRLCAEYRASLPADSLEPETLRIAHLQRRELADVEAESFMLRACVQRGILAQRACARRWLEPERALVERPP